jgi:hypothetical protein
LTADQWRSCMEFDMPVSLVQLWAGAGISSEDRRQKLVESIMLLSTAFDQLKSSLSHHTEPTTTTGVHLSPMQKTCGEWTS